MFFMFTVERPNISEQLSLNRSNCSWRCVKPFVNMLSSSPHITPCRVQESGIPVDTIYFDEYITVSSRHFFGPTEYFSKHADRCYYFTATRKTSVTIAKPGMNDREVYGDIIARVSAPNLCKVGSFFPLK